MNNYLMLILILFCSLFITGLLSSNFSTSSDLNHQNYFKDLETSPQDASTIIIGASYIRIPEKAKVVTQVDRVIKDEYSKINVPHTRAFPKLLKTIGTVHGRYQGRRTHELCRCAGNTNYRSAC